MGQALIDKAMGWLNSATGRAVRLGVAIAAEVSDVLTPVGDFFRARDGTDPITGEKVSGVGRLFSGLAVAGSLLPGEGGAKLVGKLAGETGNFKYALKALGLDKNAASKELHAIKKAAGMRGADNVWIHTGTGAVRSQLSGEVIGSIVP